MNIPMLSVGMKYKDKVMMVSYFNWLMSQTEGKYNKFKVSIADDKAFPRKTRNYEKLVDYLQEAELYSTHFDEFEESWDYFVEYLDKENL